MLIGDIIIRISSAFATTAAATTLCPWTQLCTMLPHHQKFYVLAADAAASTLPGLNAISYITNYLAVALAFTSKIDRATKALALST